MAILGMESDQVRNTTDGEVSVPITWTYHHHYGPNTIGQKAKVIKVLEGDPRIPLTGHPTLVEDGMVTIVVDDETQPYPTSRNFNTADGGEHRKRFKGMPPGAAYIRPVRPSGRHGPIGRRHRNKVAVLLGTGAAFAVFRPGAREIDVFPFFDGSELPCKVWEWLPLPSALLTARCRRWYWPHSIGPKVLAHSPLCCLQTGRAVAFSPSWPSRSTLRLPR
jgi:hypothetical protein